MITVTSGSLGPRLLPVHSELLGLPTLHSQGIPQSPLHTPPTLHTFGHPPSSARGWPDVAAPDGACSSLLHCTLNPSPTCPGSPPPATVLRWEGLSPQHCACLRAKLLQSRATFCDPLPTGLLRPWDSPGKNTGVGCHALLQGIFPTVHPTPSPQVPRVTDGTVFGILWLPHSPP